ncbi:Eco57I restriction-modification methylase domain-containing protein (plasmid) [Acinetobacter sp. ESL0695]|uniref:Eco57I restriction-modification methylase domain-containing protein n=1 Tax=Acinetobacter sp. ESL0695 TaxID=2983215 RepID=UPI0023F020CC|nr:N-6 DNA methylase [Acinetobacter sp. ESL0695]WEV50080.1 Eco57I restriction-modification methylase domain-containing protein [Acinetobacter sp. ESL0695]
MKKFVDLDTQRMNLQVFLDAKKNLLERNKLGQFATPSQLARDIVEETLKFLDQKKIKLLEPSVGTGSFILNLLDNLPADLEVEKIIGVEKDPLYGEASKEFYENTQIDLSYVISDFTQLEPFEKVNLILANPPYIRHHYIPNKFDLVDKVLDRTGIKVSGLSGMYIYFILLSHAWLEENGVACWLIPSEFLDVNYGKKLREYLLNDVTTLKIHRFDTANSKFSDALVSSTIIWYKKSIPPKNHQINFTFGERIANPEVSKRLGYDDLLKESKWSRFPQNEVRTDNDEPRLKDYFRISRGIATGENTFFILNKEEIIKKNLPFDQFRPILPRPLHLESLNIQSDRLGYPSLKKQLFVLNTLLDIEDIERKYPSLYIYLQEGIEKGVDQRHLCKSRKSWYFQEQKKTSKFYCSYIGRAKDSGKSPFKFILNESQAIVNNSYLILYPLPSLNNILEEKPQLASKIINSLNNLDSSFMTDEGRVYGGGMQKIEPTELGNVNASMIARIIENEV